MYAYGVKRGNVNACEQVRVAVCVNAAMCPTTDSNHPNDHHTMECHTGAGAVSNWEWAGTGVIGAGVMWIGLVIYTITRIYHNMVLQFSTHTYIPTEYIYLGHIYYE